MSYISEINILTEKFPFSVSITQNNTKQQQINKRPITLQALPKVLIEKILDFALQDREAVRTKNIFTSCKLFYQMRPQFFITSQTALDYATTQLCKYYEPKYAQILQEGPLPYYIGAAIKKIWEMKGFSLPLFPSVLIKNTICNKISLTLSDVYIPYRAAKIIAETWPHLRAIHFKRVSICYDETLTELVKLSNLETVNFIDSDEEISESYQARSNINLTIARTRKNGFNQVWDACQSFSALPKLKHLTISNIDYYTIFATSARPLLQMKTLQELRLINCHDFGCHIYNPERGFMPDHIAAPLRRITIFNCTGVPNSAISLILKLPHLESLIFGNSVDLGHQPQDRPPLRIMFQNLVNKKNFRELEYYGSLRNDHDLNTIQGLESLSSLESLTCIHGNDLLVNGTIPKLQNLRKLALLNAEFAQQKTVDHYFIDITHLSHLHTLRFDDGFIDQPKSFSILTACPVLENLILRGAVNGNIEWFYYIATIKTLKKIDCSNSRDITDDQLDALLQLPLLQKVIIKNCPKITDEGRRKFQKMASSVQLIY